MAVELNGSAIAALDLLQGRGDDIRVLGLIEQQDDEFVAAEPHHRVGRPHATDHPFGDGLQQFVAGVVAQAVVDNLKLSRSTNTTVTQRWYRCA